MFKKVFLFMLLTVFLLSCSGDKQDDAAGKPDKKDELESRVSLNMAKDFSIDVFLDTVKSEPLKIAGQYLKASLMQGDYKTAAEYLCRENRELLAGDSISDFIIYGKDNPEWDELQQLRYDITRRYIPVLAHYNNITRIEEVDCNEYCRVSYDITGPLLIMKMYSTAFGEGGKKLFDTYIDSNVTLQEKKEFYDWAFQRLETVADSLDYAKRMITDTLFIIKEDQQWKVARDGKNSLDLFRQK